MKKEFKLQSRKPCSAWISFIILLILMVGNNGWAAGKNSNFWTRTCQRLAELAAERGGAVGRLLTGGRKKKKDPVNPPKKEKEEVVVKPPSRLDEKTPFGKVMTEVEKGSPLGVHLQDAIQVDRVWQLVARHPDAIGVVIGNTFELNPITENVTTEIGQNLQHSPHSLVFYDADALTAPILSKYLGERGVGISSEPAKSQQPNVMVIRNGYYRLEIFSRIKTYGTPDSPLTSGLIAYSQLKGGLIDPSGKIKLGELSEWTQDTRSRYNLGASIQNPQSIFSGTLRGFGVGGGIAISPPQLGSIEGFVKGNEYKIPAWMQRATEMVEAEAYLAVNSNGEPIPGGVAVYGSGTNHGAFTELVFETGFVFARNGVPVSSGGAGGYMQVVNAAAKFSGGYSIGVNIGNHDVARERFTPSGVHTHILAVSDYGARIPLITHRKNLIDILPGGNGTLREVGYAFFVMGQNPNEPIHLIFTSRAYYQKMVEQLKAGLPADLQRRIHYVDCASTDLPPIIAEIKAELGKSSSQFATAKPRTVPYFATYVDFENSIDKKRVPDASRPLVSFPYSYLRIGSRWTLPPLGTLKIDKMFTEAGWDRYVYQVSEEQSGTKFVLKLPATHEHQFISKVKHDQERASEILALGLPAPRVLYFDGKILVREWIEGIRGDEWLKKWEADGANPFVAEFTALIDILEESARKKAYVGKWDPEDAIYSNGKWWIIDSGDVDKVTSQMAIEKYRDKINRRWSRVLSDPTKFSIPFLRALR